jgi:hypothetical protein
MHPPIFKQEQKENKGEVTHTPPNRAVAPLLAGQMSADYIRAVPTIDLPDDELAAGDHGNPWRHRRRPISLRAAP